jgi:hypothetical protein
MSELVLEPGLGGKLELKTADRVPKRNHVARVQRLARERADAQAAVFPGNACCILATTTSTGRNSISGFAQFWSRKPHSGVNRRYPKPALSSISRTRKKADDEGGQEQAATSSRGRLD